MADLFDVVADPTRRELLRALLDRAESPDGEGEASVGQLVAALGLSQPTVSKHLKTLRESHLVSVREQGQHRFYRLTPAGLGPIAEWLGPFVRPAVAAGDPVPEEVATVAAAAPARSLPPAARGVAVRVGSALGALVARLRRRSRSTRPGGRSGGSVGLGRTVV